MDVVEALVKDGRTEPSARRYMCLRQATESENITLIELIISHPKFRNDPAVNLPLFYAAARNRVQLVEKLLLNRYIDPTFCSNLAYRKARPETRELLRKVKFNFKYKCNSISESESIKFPNLKPTTRKSKM